MVLNDVELAQVSALNQEFLQTDIAGAEEVPIYACNPATTAETANLLARAGYKVYCPYFTGKIRKNRHSKAKIDAPILYFSGYVFVIGKSPKDQFPDRVSRLRFGEMFGSISVEELIAFGT